MTPYRLTDHLSTFRSYQPPSELVRSWLSPVRLAFKTVYLPLISVSYILHAPLSGMRILFILSQQPPPLRPPSGPLLPHSRDFQITHNDAPHLVGLLWTGDQPVAETSTWQHTTLTTDPPLGFEPTISAGERLHTNEVDRAATGTARRWALATKIVYLFLISVKCWTGFCVRPL